MPGYRSPTLVVDATVAEHLEILGLVPIGRLGIVECVEHADTLYRGLLHAVDNHWLRQSRRFQDRRGHVDDMRELSADLSFGFDAFRPVHNRAIARAPPMRRDLFGPLVGGVRGVRRSGR